MSLQFNHDLIAQRGGNLCGVDRFSIEACVHCQGQYLFNAELRDIYFDAEDLRRRFFKIEGMKLPPCRYCGALRWDFAALPPERAVVQSGPWAWTLQSRQFTFVD